MSVRSGNNMVLVTENEYDSGTAGGIEQAQEALRPGEALLMHGAYAPIRKNWWTEKGSQRYLNDEESLVAAVRYVLEGQ